MKRTFLLMVVATIAASIVAAPAEARGHAWFLANIKPGNMCSGAVPATYYSSGHHNSDGSRFNASGLSAASWDYPFGTVLHVVNSRNGESTDVVIKDRGPARHLYRMGIHLDLSYGAARKIHLGQNGRFESGWVCPTVMAMGDGATFERHRSHRRVARLE